MANGRPLTNRVSLPPDPAAAPASAPPTALDALISRWARIANGSDLNTPSGYTAPLRDSMLAPPPAAAPALPEPPAPEPPAPPPPAAPVAAPPATPPPAPPPADERPQFIQLFTRSGRLFAGQVQERAGQVQGAAQRAAHSRWAPLTWIAYGVLVVGALWLLVWIISAAAAWTEDHLNTLQYGDPRTTHLRATFGFAEETALNPTTITAVTEPGVGHIFIVPGGRTDKVFVLRLELPDDPDGRQPLQIGDDDLDKDGYRDLSVRVHTTTYAYLFDRDKQTFRPPTPAERDRITGGGR